MITIHVVDNIYGWKIHIKLSRALLQVLSSLDSGGPLVVFYHRIHIV